MRWLLVVLMLFIVACKQEPGERSYIKEAEDTLHPLVKEKNDEQKMTLPLFTKDKAQNQAVEEEKDMDDEDTLVVISEIEKILSEHNEKE